MKTIMKITAMLLFVAMAFGVQAQKFGYVDSKAILEGMPEVKMMNSELESLSTILQKEGQQLIQDFQAKQKSAMEEKERGGLSPVEEETILKELQEKEQRIYKFEQEMQQRLMKKEQELVGPIQTRVMDAIDAVAKENGYQYIFDGATGFILYADETSNVSSLVKTKLGI